MATTTDARPELIVTPQQFARGWLLLIGSDNRGYVVTRRVPMTELRRLLDGNIVVFDESRRHD